MEALGHVALCFREERWNHTSSCGHLFPIKAGDPAEEQGHTGVPGLWFLPWPPDSGLEGEWCEKDRRGGHRWVLHTEWEYLLTDQPTEDASLGMVQPFESLWVCCQLFSEWNNAVNAKISLWWCWWVKRVSRYAVQDGNHKSKEHVLLYETHLYVASIQGVVMAQIHIEICRY